jgi:hypothetical protein
VVLVLQWNSGNAFILLSLSIKLHFLEGSVVNMFRLKIKLLLLISMLDTLLLCSPFFVGMFRILGVLY